MHRFLTSPPSILLLWVFNLLQYASNYFNLLFKDSFSGWIDGLCAGGGDLEDCYCLVGCGAGLFGCTNCPNSAKEGYFCELTGDLGGGCTCTWGTCSWAGACFCYFTGVGLTGYYSYSSSSSSS